MKDEFSIIIKNVKDSSLWKRIDLSSYSSFEIIKIINTYTRNKSYNIITVCN